MEKYTPKSLWTKKSKVLEGEQVLNLLHKVVLVMDIFVVKMTIDDEEDKMSILLVKESDTKTLKTCFDIVDSI